MAEEQPDTCALCGEPFKRKTSNQLYCGERCRVIAKSRRRVARGGKPIYTYRWRR